MRPSLTKFAWLSIGAAIITISMKLAAYSVTGSVGLLSDALEGVVNLIAASVVLITLKVVEQPPDDEHAYGHDKAEYFSSGIEGTLIIVAAGSIAYTSIQRLIYPHPLEQPSLGLALAALASVINLVVGQTLIRAGKKHHSITLEADGHHLMSDVWTSVGVVAGVTTAVVTGINWFDPIIALVMGMKIGWDGIRIFRRSAMGLMDSAIAPTEKIKIEVILNRYRQEGIDWHALRTRQSGARRFISMHLLVPGIWSVQKAHTLSERLETDIRRAVPRASVFTHIEPVDDPAALNDLSLDR